MRISSLQMPLFAFIIHSSQAIGNHEFDLEVSGLIPFLDNVTFPVLSSNIDTTYEPSITGKFEKSTIITVDGERIGVVGYTWHGTPSVSKTGEKYVLFQNSYSKFLVNICQNLKSF